MYFLPPLLILLAIYGIKLAGDGLPLSAAAITDTDTQMRLAYLREIIAHGWQDGYFGRDNTPYGVVLQWTRPFYGIVLALYETFRTILPPERALIYAGYFTGPLLQLITSVALYWAGRAILSRPLALAATLAVVLSSGFFFYDKPGTANHHSLLLLDYVVVIGLTLRLRSENWLLALSLGFATGFAVWTSFEMLVLAGAVFALLLYLWILNGDARQFLAVAVGYGAVSLLSLLIDPPYGGRSVLALDHPGLPQLMLSVLPLLLALATRGAGKRWQMRLGFGVIGSFIVLGAWGWLFFGHWGSLIQRIDPMVASEMHPTISEMGPVRHLWLALIILGNGFIGLVAAVIFMPRNRYYIPLITFLAVLGIAGTLHIRFAEYFWIAGSLTATWCLQKRLTSAKENVTALLGLIFASAFLIIGCQMIGFSLHGHAKIEAAAQLEKNCLISAVAPALNDTAWLRGGDNPVFANDFELTPGLLFFTHARTLAGYYHRDVPGVGDSFLLFRGPSRSIAAQHDVEFVLVCPGMGDSTFGTPSLALFYKQGDHRQPTLYNHLEDGTPPPWLTPRPWPAGIKTNLLLYQVQ